MSNLISPLGILSQQILVILSLAILQLNVLLGIEIPGKPSLSIKIMSSVGNMSGQGRLAGGW